jgi:hypothetical protein
MARQDHVHDTTQVRGAVTRDEVRALATRVAVVERQLEIEREIIRTIVGASPQTAVAILQALAWRARDLDQAGQHDMAAAMLRVIEEARPC